MCVCVCVCVIQDVGAGDAGYVSAVGRNEVEGHGEVVVCCWVGCTLHEELLHKHTQWRDYISQNTPGQTDVTERSSSYLHVLWTNTALILQRNTHTQIREPHALPLRCRDNQLIDKHRGYDQGRGRRPNRTDPETQRQRLTIIIIMLCNTHVLSRSVSVKAKCSGSGFHRHV